MRETLVSTAGKPGAWRVTNCQAVDGTVKNLITNEVRTSGQLAPLPFPAAPVLTPAARPDHIMPAGTVKTNNAITVAFMLALNGGGIATHALSQPSQRGSILPVPLLIT